MTVVSQQPLHQADDVAALWRRAGEVTADRFDRIDARLGNLERDVAVLKADVTILKADVAILKHDVAILKHDVAILKHDVAELKAQVGRLERSTESRFNRVDAQLERLIGLVQRAESGRNPEGGRAGAETGTSA